MLVTAETRQAAANVRSLGAETTGLGKAAQGAQQAARQTGQAVETLGKNAQKSAQYAGMLVPQLNDVIMMAAAGQAPLSLMMQQGTQITQVFDLMRGSGQSVGATVRSALLGMVNPMNLVTMGALALGTYAVQALMNMGEKAVSVEDAMKAAADSVKAFRDEAGRSSADVVKDFGAISAETAELQRNLTELARTRAQVDLKQAVASLGINGWNESRRTGQIADLLGTVVSPFDATGRAGQASAEVKSFGAALDSLNKAKGPSDQLRIVRNLADQLVTAAGGIDQMSLAQSAYYGHLLETESAIQRIVTAQAVQLRQKIELGLAAGTIYGPTVLDIPKPVDPEKSAKGRASAAQLIASAREENELARLKLVYGEQSVQVRQAELAAARAALEAKITEMGIDRQGLQAQQLRGQLAVQQALAEAQRIDTQRNAAADMVAQYQAEAEIAQLTAQYGANSLEVAYARSAAERDVVAAQIEAQGYTGQQAADMLAAWDAARGIAGVNMAAGIGAAADAARVLAAQLGVSLSVALQLANFDPTAGKGKGAMAGVARVSFGGTGGLGFGSGTSLGYGDLNDSSSFKSADIPKISGIGKGGGGGGGGAKSETNEVKKLIEQLERENAVLKILDPAQREIEQNHKALAKATVTEKASVADLIAERQRLEAIRDALDEIGRTGKDAFVGLTTRASTFKEAIGQLLSKLAEMAASSAWDILWGGGSSGGGLGSLLGGLLGGGSSGGTGSFGLPLPFADGGLIGGVGGPREDNQLIRASVGEFIMNAEATRKALPLLQAINAGVPVDRLVDLIGGRRPRFADGGLVGDIGSAAPSGWRAGRSSASSGGFGASGAQQMALDVGIYVDRDGNWQAAVENIAGSVAVKTTKAGLEQFSQKALPGRVRQIQSAPRFA
jgi:hypothetical protein